MLFETNPAVFQLLLPTTYFVDCFPFYRTRWIIDKEYGDNPPAPPQPPHFIVYSRLIYSLQCDTFITSYIFLFLCQTQSEQYLCVLFSLKISKRSLTEFIFSKKKCSSIMYCFNVKLKLTFLCRATRVMGLHLILVFR